MLTCFAYIIRSINPSQTENKKNNLSAEMLSDLLFINRNSASLGCNTTIDVFGVSIYSVANVVDEMESNPDAFSDASDAE